MKDPILQAGSAGAASAGAGAAGVAAAASACCAPVVAPIVIALFGASGSVWAAGLRPYAPHLMIGSLLLLVLAFWSAYRPRRVQSAEGPAFAIARGPLWVRIVVWAAAAVWLTALALNLFL